MNIEVKYRESDLPVKWVVTGYKYYRQFRINRGSHTENLIRKVYEDYRNKYQNAPLSPRLFVITVLRDNVLMNILQNKQQHYTASMATFLFWWNRNRQREDTK